MEERGLKSAKCAGFNTLARRVLTDVLTCVATTPGPSFDAPLRGNGQRAYGEQPDSRRHGECCRNSERKLDLCRPSVRARHPHSRSLLR